MTSESANSIIAAIIALLSSLLSFLLSSFFQLKREERARNWHKEDLKLQRRLEVIRTRVNDIHFFLDKYLELQNKMINLETSVMQIPMPKGDYDRACSEILILIDETNKKFAPIYSLGDEEILTIALLINNLINSEYKTLTELIGKRIEDEEINYDTEMTRITSLRIKGYELSVKMTKRLDELSGLY